MNCSCTKRSAYSFFTEVFAPWDLWNYTFFGCWQQQSCKLSAKKVFVIRIIQILRQKAHSSLVCYVVCIENLYFSICRCVCSNLWDFQFFVSSSFLFPRFLVAVIDDLIFSLLRSLHPPHMLWHMTFHTTRLPSLAVFLRWHFYVAVTLLLFYSRF